ITSAQTRSFSDLDGHWAKSAVEEAAGIGFINGYPDNTFRPDARINRAEFAAMLARAVPLSAEGETMLSYADADQIPEWAAPHIAAATASGILIGYSDRTFRWNSSITRAEMTVMIARTAHLELSEDTPAGFADDSEIPAWAYREVSTAKASGLIQGKNNNLFDSSCSATRAEAVTIILNLLHKSEG
ncbi:S-layer homology domain-containing protein, partial [Paenibacillus sepulcri]|nr:S-layer homology domain-containing protein [Paenibacillus sepulcri]